MKAIDGRDRQAASRDNIFPQHSYYRTAHTLIRSQQGH